MGMLTEDLLILLQQKVSAEMARRKYGNGPLTQYADNAITNPFTPGSLVKADAGANTLDLLLKISDINGLGEEYKSKRGVKIPEQFNDELIELVDDFALEGQVGPSSCRANCTGLCDSTCTGTCTSGCAGGCTSCSGCTGGCSGCSGCSGCGGRCSYSCSGGCDGCSGGCSGCGGGCSFGCTGCGGGCSNTAANQGCSCGGCGSCGGFCGGGYSE